MILTTEALVTDVPAPNGEKRLAGIVHYAQFSELCIRVRNRNLEVTDCNPARQPSRGILVVAW
jgi:hypothetical protein